MVSKRKPYQGVWNIIRFNWHFYAAAAFVTFCGIIVLTFLSGLLLSLVYVGLFLAIWMTVVSLMVSFYVYDCSDLYELHWFTPKGSDIVLNINAGFDETSELIRELYPAVELHICDFYDQEKHTEVSIKRAREAYPLSDHSLRVSTTSLPYATNQFDKIVAMLSVHEIRNAEERDIFFDELYRILKYDGQLIVVEHLRDFPNFLAYSIGFFHFLSRKSWYATFDKSGFIFSEEVKITPFVSVFLLSKNGNSH